MPKTAAVSPSSPPVSPVVPPSTTPVTPQAPATAANSDAARYLARGRQLLEQGNVAGARNFLERAADGNSAEAALDMARTFDPAVLQAPGSRFVGVVPDPARARSWYQRAEKLGATGVAARIQQLSK